jgi:agmatine deiminase
MTRVFFFLIFLGLLTQCKTKEEAMIMPAEWEKQDAVLLTYTEDPNDSLTSFGVRSTCDELIDVIAKRMKIYVLINEDWNSDSLTSIFNDRGFNTKNIELIKVNELFSMGVARDYGPLVIRNQSGQRKLLKFNWDYVGADMLNPDTSWTNWKNEVRRKYFEQMSKLLKMDIVESELTIEGGEIELNGQGTALLVESFTKPRHPKMDIGKFGSLLELSLGVSNIIWLKEGIAEDPSSLQSYVISKNIYGFGVGGHVDEFARFADSNTILLTVPDSVEATIDPVKKINYERMNRNFDILSNSKDQNGDTFKIIKVPIPDILADTFVIDTTRNQRLQIRSIMRKNPHLKQGDTIHFLPAVSYLNYIVLNDIVIIPKYWGQGFPESTKRKDDEVKELFQRLYPKKDIVQLNPLGLNYAGGGFHCWTQQISYN